MDIPERNFFKEILSHIEYTVYEFGSSLAKKTTFNELATEAYDLLQKDETCLSEHLNKEWERKHIRSLITLFNLFRECKELLEVNGEQASDPSIEFPDCAEDESRAIIHVIGIAIENLESRFFDAMKGENVTLSRLDAEALMDAALYRNFCLKDQRYDNLKLYGSRGGMQAAKNRAQTRKQVREKSKEYIQKLYLWNDGTQTIKSITDTIWAGIQTAMDSGNEWQGISNADLQQAKVGRKTVYDAVKQTHPR